MKTVYLCDCEQNVRNIFGTREPVFSKADILNDAEKFQDTQYIFSTWDIPVFTEEEIRTYLPGLKAVFYGAGSVQYFARPFLNCGVKVFSAWMANAVPVAEYTVAQIILANKGFFQGSRLAKLGEYEEASAAAQACHGNYGEKVGIIGAGTIGTLVIHMLKAYNLEVLVFDPFLPDEKAAELGVTKCALETLFKTCQTVSNHLANNDQTQRMLRYAHFSAMRPHATFLNTGRGAQVAEEDLVRALTERPDLTAVLDVTMPEPPEKGHAFYSLPNCVLTPHIAGSFGDEVRRMGEYMQAEYENFVQGKPCQYEVTLEMLKTMA